MTIEKILRETMRTFKESGFDHPDQEAEQLLGIVLGRTWSDLILKKQDDFPIEKIELLSTYVSRRKQGEPLAYIEGIKHFYKYDFYVNPSVLIPRPETEIIIDQALQYFSKKKVQKIFDIGCGSGCLGLSLAKEYPEALVHLFDISKEAVEITKKNIESLRLEQRTKTHVGEINENPQVLLELKNSVDIIVANPPYISEGDDRVQSSVRDFEPDLALYAKDGGIQWIEKWMKWSEFYLSPQGIGIFEFGKGQKSAVLQALTKNNMKLKKIVKDYSQEDRHIIFAKG